MAGRRYGIAVRMLRSTMSVATDPVASSSQQAETGIPGDLLRDLRACGAGHCAIPQIEPELPVRLTDEIQHGHAVLTIGEPQAASQLLQEHQRAFCWAEEKQCIHLR